MAKNQTKRINPDVLGADEDTFTSVKALPGYKPHMAECEVTAIQAVKAAMIAAQEAEVAADNALKTARDQANAAEWAFHNVVLSSKDQVASQYGKDSNEYQSLGLKKKSEYKTPGRRTTSKS